MLRVLVVPPISFFTALALSATLSFGVGTQSSQEVAGTFAPEGAPVSPPTRTDAGGACVVDLKQEYQVSGPLSGQMEIDYRILVAGPCGAPPGTFHEEWIALGTFSGVLREAETEARFTYVAEVQPGGDVAGEMTFGPGLVGTLRIQGNFADSSLAYSGSIQKNPSEPLNPPW